MLNPVGLEVADTVATIADTRQPVMKKTLIRAKSRRPCCVSVWIASSRAMACFWVKAGVVFFSTPSRCLDGGDVLGGFPGDQTFGRQLLVGAA